MNQLLQIAKDYDSEYNIYDNQLLNVQTEEELLHFFVFLRAFIDATADNINKRWRDDATRWFYSNDFFYNAETYCNNPEGFVDEVRKFLSSKKKPARTYFIRRVSE